MAAIQMSRDERHSLEKILRRPCLVTDIPAEHAEKLLNYGLVKRDVMLLHATPNEQRFPLPESMLIFVNMIPELYKERLHLSANERASAWQERAANPAQSPTRVPFVPLIVPQCTAILYYQKLTVVPAPAEHGEGIPFPSWPDIRRRERGPCGTSSSRRLSRPAWHPAPSRTSTAW